MAPELFANIPTPSSVRHVLGHVGSRLTIDEMKRILTAIGLSEADADAFEVMKETDDDGGEDEEWDAIMQATIVYMEKQQSPPPQPQPAASPPQSYPPTPSFSRQSSSLSTPTQHNNRSFSFISRSSASFTEKVDIYGLGMLMWSMVELRLNPFANVPTPLIPFLVTHGVRPKMPSATPPLLCKLVTECWNATAAHRPSAIQVIDRLECIQYQLCGIAFRPRIKPQTNTPQPQSVSLQTAIVSNTESNPGPLAAAGIDEVDEGEELEADANEAETKDANV